MRVEGIVRNVGMHAGGVLIAPGKITDFCPLYQQPGSDSGGEPVRQGRCRGHRPGQVRLPGPGHADDPGAGQGLHPRAPARPRRTSATSRCRWTTRAVYKLFADGRTEAVFQFESRGMQGMLRDAKPSRLEDLIALERDVPPRADGEHPELLRAQARHASPSPTRTRCWSPVLGETYGIFVYQEQVMHAAQVLAGYSLGGADILRRRWARRRPRRWPSSARSSARVRRAKASCGPRPTRFST